MGEKKILVARTAGFCFGVKRAVEKVYEQVSMGKQNIYTYGPIIHNEEVVTDLEKKGVRVLENEQELKDLMEGTVVIRSHGVPKEIYEVIEEKGLECVDATCPFVRKIHKIVERESKAGRHIIIVGNDTHPEVEGIKGWCEGPVTVISSPASFIRAAKAGSASRSFIRVTASWPWIFPPLWLWMTSAPLSSGVTAHRLTRKLTHPLGTFTPMPAASSTLRPV